MRLTAFALPVCLLLSTSAFGQDTYTFYGIKGGDNLGDAVGAAGDVNQDGFGDIIVGAPFADHGSDFNSGMARVYSGADGSVLHTFWGDAMLDLFGRSVDGVGDWNGDGHADVAVGAFAAGGISTPAGQVKIHSGLDGSTLYSWTAAAVFDGFGVSLGAAGDTNNDGFVDLIAGAWGSDIAAPDAGSATLYSGANGTILNTFLGFGPGDAFGCSTRGAGDVDADGFDDVIVGAYSADLLGADSGGAWVYSGKTYNILHAVAGTAAGANFGISVSGAGDVNSDGYDDVIMGAFYDDMAFTDAGSAAVLSGKDGAYLHLVTGFAANDLLGGSVSHAGDRNLDGFDDFIVGAQKADDNGTDSGAAYLFSGQDGSVLTKYVGDAAGDWFGMSVSSAGDVNGDGLGDLVVGAIKHDVTSGDEGMARVYFDCGAGIISYGSGCAGSGGFIPTFKLSGCTTTGALVSGSIDRGYGGSVAVVIFGLNQAALPLGFGCTLNITPVLPVALPIPLGGSGPGTGSVQLAAAIPPGVPTSSIVIQAYIIDPGAPLGASLTNGLELHFP